MKLIEQAISTLREQIAPREKAIAALGHLDAFAEANGAGDTVAPKHKYTRRGKRAKRTMSPEGRARIAAAQKARWARVRKQAKRAA